jgi:hypothetical protein
MASTRLSSQPRLSRVQTKVVLVKDGAGCSAALPSAYPVMTTFRDAH